MSGSAAGRSDWIRARQPPVPEPFVRRLLARGGTPPGDGSLEELLAAMAPALRAALAREGERSGAFQLLAADAWVTWAAEEALAGSDPETALGRVLDEVLAAAEVP